MYGHKMRGFIVTFAGSYAFGLAASACVPDAPRNLIYEKAVLEHDAVIQALEGVQQYLSEKYSNGTTRDGLSVAIVGLILFFLLMS